MLATPEDEAAAEELGADCDEDEATEPGCDEEEAAEPD